MRFRLLALAVLLAATVPAARKQTFNELVRDSSGIVLGKVLNTSSYFGPDGEIYTDVTLGVRSRVKDRSGRLANTMTFTVPGGQVGDTKVVFSETPAFETDENVMVFLDDNGRPDEKYRLEGDFVAELGRSATAVLAEMAAEEPVAEERPARAFLKEIEAQGGLRNTPATPPCYVLIGPKWLNNAASYKLTTSLPAGWAAQVTAAAQSWSNAGSPFRFTANEASANEVILGPITGGSILAQTRIQYQPSTNALIRFTLTYNSNFTWSTTGAAGQFDVQGIGAHELGHALGLTHPPEAACSETTMWATASSGETKKRTLETGDINGVRAIYGNSNTTPPPPPPPPPPPAPAAPVLNSVSLSPTAPLANQWFFLLMGGTGFQATAQVVITGPGCATTSPCLISGGQVFVQGTTTMYGVTRLPAGNYEVGVRNGATGTVSNRRPIVIR